MWFGLIRWDCGPTTSAMDPVCFLSDGSVPSSCLSPVFEKRLVYFSSFDALFNQAGFLGFAIRRSEVAS